MSTKITYQGPTVTLSAEQCTQLLEVESLLHVCGRERLQPLWDLFGAAHRCHLAARTLADAKRDHDTIFDPNAGPCVVIESRRPVDLDATGRKNGTIARNSEGAYAVAVGGRWRDRSALPFMRFGVIEPDPSLRVIRSLLPEGWRIERQLERPQGRWRLTHSGHTRAMADNPALLLAHAYECA